MTNTTPFSWNLYHQAPIIGNIRGKPKDLILKIAKAYQEAGLTNLEITMNTEEVQNILTTLRKDFPNLNIGAGTVCNEQDLERAVQAGAQYIVTPILEEQVIRKAVGQKIPIFPGAFTPSEIYKAWQLGAAAVKVFPASQLGPSFVKEVRGPLDNIKLIPTGGVNLTNLTAYFKAGAFGVGMGSCLWDKSFIQQRDFEGLTKHFRKIKAALNIVTEKV